MTTIGGRALALGLTMAVVLGANARASADECSCQALPGGAVANLSHFKSAFAGRVESVEAKDGQTVVTFAVARAWKGPRGKSLTLTTPAGACGARFEKDQAYLVYAAGEKNALTTDSCAPNVDIAAASGSVRQLDLHAGYGGNPMKMPATADNAKGSSSASAK